MLIGFNNDVEFNGRMYHIQTEDNGIKNASITSTVFIQGQSLERKGVSYADLLDDHPEGDGRTKAIRKRMVDLHREFYKKLFDGAFEEQTQRILGAKASLSSTSSGLSKSQSGVSKSQSGVTAAATSTRPGLKKAGTTTRTNRAVKTPPPRPSSSDAHEFDIDLNLKDKGAGVPHPMRDVFGTPAPPQVAWRQTGRQAFRGLRWPKTDLRIDGLVAQFLDSL